MLMRFQMSLRARQVWGISNHMFQNGKHNNSRCPLAIILFFRAWLGNLILPISHKLLLLAIITIADLLNAHKGQLEEAAVPLETIEELTDNKYLNTSKTPQSTMWHWFQTISVLVRKKQLISNRCDLLMALLPVLCKAITSKILATKWKRTITVRQTASHHQVRELQTIETKDIITTMMRKVSISSLFLRLTLDQAINTRERPQLALSTRTVAPDLQSSSRCLQSQISTTTGTILTTLTKGNP